MSRISTKSDEIRQFTFQMKKSHFYGTFCDREGGLKSREFRTISAGDDLVRERSGETKDFVQTHSLLSHMKEK